MTHRTHLAQFDPTPTSAKPWFIWRSSGLSLGTDELSTSTCEILFPICRLFSSQERRVLLTRIRTRAVPLRLSKGTSQRREPPLQNPRCMPNCGASRLALLLSGHRLVECFYNHRVSLFRRQKVQELDHGRHRRSELSEAAGAGPPLVLRVAYAEKRLRLFHAACPWQSEAA